MSESTSVTDEGMSREEEDHFHQEWQDQHEEGFSLVGLLDHYLEENNEERENKGFNASDMGGCFLKRYWKREGKKFDAPNARKLRVFEVGHIVHKFLQDVAKTGKNIKVLECETELELDGFMFGHPDLLIEHNGKLILYDIKTVHSRKFHYSVNPRNGNAKDDLNYIAQLHTYALMLEKKYPRLTDCRILYVSKDDLSMAEKSYPFTEAARTRVKSEIDQIKMMWDKKEEPKPIPQEDWECGYCVYQAQCPSGQIAMQKLAGKGVVEL